MTKEAFEKEKPTPDLDQILEVAKGKFFEPHSPMTPSGFYEVGDAAKEAIQASSLSPIELAARLVQQSSLTVEETGILEILEGQRASKCTWDYLFFRIAEGIVSEELLRRYPDIRDIQRRNTDEWIRLYDQA